MRPSDNRDDEYSYTDAGFDSFLSRSIDNTPRVNLDSQGLVSTAIRYDSAQVSGMLGDTLTIGKIRLDGATGRISVVDENEVETVRIGDLGD